MRIKALINRSRTHFLLSSILSGTIALIGIIMLESQIVQAWDGEHWIFAGLLAVLLLSFLIQSALRIQNGQFDPFEPPILFGFFFFVTFGLNSLQLLSSDPILPDNVDFYWLNKALMLYLVGWVALWFGYRSSFGDTLTSRLDQTRARTRREPVTNIMTWGFLIYAIGLVPKIVQIRLGLYGVLKAQNWDMHTQSLPWLQALTYMEWIGRYGLVLLMMAWLVQEKRAAKISLLFLVPLELLFALISSYRTPIVQLFFTLGITSFYIKRRLPLHYIMLALVVLMLMNQFLSVYRALLYTSWISVEADQNHLAPMIYVATEFFTVNPTTEVLNLSGPMLLQKTMYLPEMAMGVWYRDTFGPLENPLLFLLRSFIVFVPRFLWPEKPIDNLGSRFNVEVAGSTDVTASTPFLPGWLYMETSLPGLIFYLFFLGICYRILYKFYTPPHDASRIFLAPLLAWTLTLEAVGQEPFAGLHPLVYQLMVLLIIRRIVFRTVQPSTRIRELA